ncbi:MAG: pyridoxal-phosphate dependent enzyme [bacterium]
MQLERRAVTPDYVVSPVGSGAYASGLFLPFVDDERTHLVGVQAAGRDEDYASVASKGVMYGTKSFVLQDGEGLPIYRDTEAGGLAHNAVGPQHATWADRGQAFYTLVNDFDAAQAARALAVYEGVLVNQETGHALAYASRLAQTLEPTANIIVGITGSGHRDLSRLHTKGDA